MVTATVAVAAVGWLVWPEPSPASTSFPMTRSDAGAGGVTFVGSLVAAGPDSLDFDVQFDTHTVDLSSYDVAERVLLRDGDGRTYPATVLERSADSTSHHVEATLRFARPDGARALLVATDLGGVSERVLEFPL